MASQHSSLLRDRSKELAAALEAAREAARVIEACGAPARMVKADASPVTIADVAGQCAITKILRARLGDEVRIAGEESVGELERAGATAALDPAAAALSSVGMVMGGGDVAYLLGHGADGGGAGEFWAIDPLDGTKGYLRGGQFAIAIALISEGVPQVAVLAAPRLHPGEVTLFQAVRGKGAWQSIGSAERQQIVAAPYRRGHVRLAESVESSHSAHDRVRQLLGSSIEVEHVRMDSSVKYGLLARGDVDCYLRVPPRSGYAEKVWDHAAGILIAHESGCVSSDALGNPLRFDLGREMTPGAGVFCGRAELASEVFGCKQ